MKRRLLLPVLLAATNLLQAQQPSAVKPANLDRIKMQPEKLPDLQLRNLRATYTEGQGLLVEYEVMNNGTGPANMNTINLDGTIALVYDERPGGGTVLTQVAANNMLEPGQVKAGTLRLTTTLDKTKASSYSYRLVADRDNAIKESNENNNAAAVQIKFVEPPPPPSTPKATVVKPASTVAVKNNPAPNTINPKPELSVQIKNLRYTNGVVECEYAVTNSGVVAVETSRITVQAFISDNTGGIYPAGGTTLNTRQGMLIGHNETVTGATRISINMTLDRAKSYTYKVIVDYSKQIDEDNESNNEATMAINF